MNSKNLLLTTRFGLLSVLIASYLSSSGVFAEETKFTYQGRLNDTVGAANGVYDFTFTIYDLPTGTGAFAVETNLAVGVTNGCLRPPSISGPSSVKRFSAGHSDGWKSRCDTNGATQFLPLNPRQRLTATPYAITAANVISNGLSAGTYSNPFNFNNPGNNFSGNGGGLTNVSASTLGGLGTNAFWRASGNAGRHRAPILWARLTISHLNFR